LAIYVPDSTRRRRVIVIAGACLIVGLVVGGALGRATSSGVADSVSRVRAQAQDAVTAFERLPIEYEQALAGTGGESTATITEALGRARATLDAAYSEIDVFGPASRSATDAAVDAIARAVADKVPLAEFEAVIADAVAAVRATFGLAGG
jgi:flavin-binding protein dodecin